MVHDFYHSFIPSFTLLTSTDLGIVLGAMPGPTGIEMRNLLCNIVLAGPGLRSKYFLSRIRLEQKRKE